MFLKIPDDFVSRVTYAGEVSEFTGYVSIGSTLVFAGNLLRFYLTAL